MSGVLNRTMRIENRKGRYRFGDWNIVNTSIGPCWEPRYMPLGVHDKSMAADTALSVDPDDQINRIDMITFDWDRRDPFHRDPKSRRPLIGGNLTYWVRHSFN